MVNIFKYLKESFHDKRMKKYVATDKDVDRYIKLLKQGLTHAQIRDHDSMIHIPPGSVGGQIRQKAQQKLKNA